MTLVKAKLTVVLKANDVVVAEVDDARLWQRVLAAISGGGLDMRTENGDKQSDWGVALPVEPADTSRTNAATQPLNALAQKIGTQVTLVEGACAPSGTPPTSIWTLIAGRRRGARSPAQGRMRFRRSHYRLPC